jgi:general secretion pathway protein G
MKKKRGMASVEIVGLILILGVLAWLASSSLPQNACPSRVTITKAQIQRIKGEVELYKADKERYPDTLQDLVPRYLSEVPKDGWDRPFIYRSQGTRGPYDIVSLGEDGLPGGEGANADLWSHPLVK